MLLFFSERKKSHRVRASEGANKVRLFFRRHARRKNSLGRARRSPLAPTNQRAISASVPFRLLKNLFFDSLMITFAG